MYGAHYITFSVSSFGRVVKRLTGLNPPLDYSKRTEVIINGKVHTVFEVSGGKMRYYWKKYIFLIRIYAG